MVYDTYQENFTTFPHLAGTLSFYNIINTVLQKMLGVSDIRAVLQEADSLQGLVGGNVFDSHSRLRVILNNTGTSAEHRIWVAEGLFYMAKNERFDKTSARPTSRATIGQATRAFATSSSSSTRCSAIASSGKPPCAPTTSCSARMCRSPSGSRMPSSRA